MDVSRILSELKAEREKLDQAIAALEGLRTKNVTRPKTAVVSRTAPKRGGRRLSAAARKKLSAMMKARWASGKMGKGKKTA